MKAGKTVEVVGTSAPDAGVKENCRMNPLRVRKKKRPPLSIAGRTETSEFGGATQVARPKYGARVAGLIPTTTEHAVVVAASTTWPVAEFQMSRAFSHVASYARVRATAIVDAVTRYNEVVPPLIAKREPAE